MDIIQKRFDELQADAKVVDESVQSHTGQVTYKSVDEQLQLRWRTSVLDLLSRVFGAEEAVYMEFARHVQKYDTSNTHEIFLNYQAIFLSAKDIFEGDYRFDVQKLVHAEVFSDELEQAKHFLDLEHKIPAAVIAGTVLETTLRKLCESNGIDKMTDKGKNKMADVMISDLAKVPVFNKMVVDQLRAWVKIRNSAAHGHPEEFDEGVVGRMIEGVRDFVAGQMS